MSALGWLGWSGGWGRAMRAPSRAMPTWRGLYNVAMNAQDIRELVSRTPFEPIRLHLSNGQTHVINNPDLVVVMRSAIFLAFDEDRFTLIPIRHIASVESSNAA